MELVEGEDLAHRMLRGAIPIDEALPMARQIAEAIEFAHDAGVIHRDLKPANIKVRHDGTVKVLDFGLAKALDPGGGLAASVSSALAGSHTITSPAMTLHGVILGTAAYMSPEQAKGKPVDTRADIWAFGCVLYEMLTGRRAFKGDDVTDTLTSVMRDTPDWSALPAPTPEPIRTLLRRCLAKDPRERVPHIAVARLDIDDAATSANEAARRPLRHRIARGLAGLSPASRSSAPRPSQSFTFVNQPPPHRRSSDFSSAAMTWPGSARRRSCRQTGDAWRLRRARPTGDTARCGCRRSMASRRPPCPVLMRRPERCSGRLTAASSPTPPARS